MGIRIQAEAVIFGCCYRSCGRALTRALGYNYCGNDLLDNLTDVWENFSPVYCRKYKGLKKMNLMGFGGISDANSLYDIDYGDASMYLGVDLEGLEVCDNQENGTWYIKPVFPSNVREIAKDFLAFTLKYGHVEWDGKYTIIPDDEAHELVSKSGISIPNTVGVHKTIDVSA